MGITSSPKSKNHYLFVWLCSVVPRVEAKNESLPHSGSRIGTEYQFSWLHGYIDKELMGPPSHGLKLKFRDADICLRLTIEYWLRIS